MRSSVVVVSSGFALAACSLFTDLDGLSDTARRADGGSSSESGPLPDDSSATDGPALADAGDGAVARPCAPGHTHFLCADFDEGEVVEREFTERVTSDDGTIDFDTSSFVSAGRSMRARTPRVTGDTQQIARLAKAIPTPPRTAHLEADVFMCEIAGGTFELLKFQERPTPTTRGGLELFIRRDRVVNLAAEMTGGTSSNTDGNVALGSNRWVHITMDVTFASSNGRVALYYDNDLSSPVLERSGIQTLSPQSINEFVIGLWTPDSTTECVTRIDNVVLDLEL